jgi:hypothetical protein
LLSVLACIHRHRQLDGGGTRSVPAAADIVLLMHGAINRRAGARLGSSERWACVPIDQRTAFRIGA